MNTRTKNKLLNELDPIDKTILTHLKQGFSQHDISVYLKRHDIKPNSLSIIEKRMKAMREKFNAHTNFHLAVILYS